MCFVKQNANYLYFYWTKGEYIKYNYFIAQEYFVKVFVCFGNVDSYPWIRHPT